MGSHPLNLALRFILELCALYSIGLWGWKTQEGWMKYLFAYGIPILLMVIWGTFAVPNDPSRSGQAPIVTPGVIRLAIELAIFGFATWALYDSDFTKVSIIFGLIIVAHYVISYDRVIWLLNN